MHDSQDRFSYLDNTRDVAGYTNSLHLKPHKEGNSMTTSTQTTTTYLSKKGMKELKKRLADLREQLGSAMQQLRELDKIDSREERFARIEKLDRIEAIENDIVELESRLATAKPMPRKRDALKVALGSVVELVDQQGRLLRYTLVDSFEANPSDGRISVMSPLGQSLIDKTVQQTIEWTTGKLKTQRLQLVAIH